MATELCILQVDHRLYAVPMDCVVEVMESVRLWDVPLPPEGLLGLVRHDGQPVPAVDAGCWLEGTECGRARRVCVVVHSGEFFLALMVDRVYPATAWRGGIEKATASALEKLAVGRVTLRRWWQPDAPEGDVDDPGDLSSAQHEGTEEVTAWLLDVDQVALRMEERWVLPLAA